MTRDRTTQHNAGIGGGLTSRRTKPGRRVPHATRTNQLAEHHAAPIDQVALNLGSDPKQGLDQPRAAELLAVHGYNELAEKPPEPWWKRLLRQFNELTIWILLAAAVVSTALADWVDGLVILAIVILNGLLGFIQEGRAGRALLALRRMSAPKARVIRGGVLESLPARELVPGDRVEIEAGDVVPADLRLIHSTGLRTQEATLTGESLPVDKDHRRILHEAAPLADRHNMAFMGTAVAAGAAAGLVVATGMHTQLGQIAGMLDQDSNETTPLQKRLAELGKTLAVVVAAVTALIFLLNLLHGGRLVSAFLLSISLAVAAVPEGLPAVITIALALGLQRMARRNALIRRLPSVETLGSVTVICSDKTGTLTRNEMTVREIETAHAHYEVQGSGYAPIGQFLRHEDGHKPAAQAVQLKHESDLAEVLTIGAWCNHAHVSPASQDGTWTVVGDPTEGALVVAALKAGIATANGAHEFADELPFDAERKAMSVLARTSRGLRLYTKGAPEVILSMCRFELRNGVSHALTDARRAQIAATGAGMGLRALRVLGLAYKNISEKDPARIEERDLVFAGLIGMMDPPREEAKAAVSKCHTAGIRPVMITGDHPKTAYAVARELGIADADCRVISGTELEAISEEELAAQVEKVSVYARVAPEHKLRIVRALQGRGHIVAMTGDGVNDAPAVKAANIGIAMGITGTDVTKQVSDMVLTDDNFASIVAAVEEGRGIFDNIRKAVHFLLASNASEILLMLCAALVGWPAPLLAIQILWINLVTDSLPALALGIDPADKTAMSRPPRPSTESVLNRRSGLLILWQGLLIAAAAAVTFVITYRGVESRLAVAQTATFYALASGQLFFALSCRSRKLTLPQLGILSNIHLLAAIAGGIALQVAIILLPQGRTIFKLSSMDGYTWAVAIAASLVPVTIIELLKLAATWKTESRISRARHCS